MRGTNVGADLCVRQKHKVNRQFRADTQVCPYRKLLLSVCFLLMTWNASAQTLDDYVQEALEHNPSLEASYKSFEASMQRVAQAKGFPDPVLGFGYFISPVETRVGPQRAKFSLNQMFPWFGTLSAKRDVMALRAEADYQRFLDDRNMVVFKVKGAYYPLLELDEKIEWQQENLQLLTTYREMALSRFRNGQGTMVDVLRVDMSIDDTKIEITLLEQQKWPLQVQFNRLLNRSDSLEIMHSDSLVMGDSLSLGLRDSLIAQNPALERIELMRQSAIAQKTLARKQGMPQLGVGVDYVIVGKNEMDVPDNGQDVLMPMATISLPVFRGKYKAMSAEAELMEQSFEASKLAMENSLVVDVESVLYELERSRQTVALYDEQIGRTKQAVTLLISSYSTSGNDFVEVLRMQKQAIKYELAKATELKKYWVAMAKLEYLIGEPL